MSDTVRVESGIWQVFVAIVFWGFVAAKWWGTIFAHWSWWWLLLPIVPWCGYAVQRLHL